MMRINILLLVVLCCGIGILEAQDFSKWIVVTTIQYPTPQLKKLAQLEGWHLLVVGDKKTPSDWQLENAEYLSPEKQLSLGYSLAPLLPWNHYSRKNIGYLYAIEQGASLIYETDDDNEPIDRLNPLSVDNTLPVLTSPKPYINMYAYFGQPQVWPRGYPLEGIKDNQWQMSEQTNCVIGIEQGLVDQDADVDAIFRLTQGRPIIFSQKNSCVLDYNVFCPFNSQNTFIHKDAFFTLYLPSYVTMRISDIWRGYIAEKLLNEIGLQVAFSSPNVIQLRNEHNLLKDFILEQDMYCKSMNLINFLRQWKSSFYTDCLQNMYVLFENLVQENFLDYREVELCKAWLTDLAKIGYLAPINNRKYDE